MYPSWLAIKNEDERGQAEAARICHEEGPGVYKKEGDGNGVTRKEEKRKAEKKIFRCSEERYGRSWCDREGYRRQNAVEKHHTLWLFLIKKKG